MSFLTAFTDLVIRFNDELIGLYPTEIEFKTGKTAIQLIKRTNPRMLLLIFKAYIEPWRVQIQNKDEIFFMEKDYKNEVVGDQNILMLIERLKEKWEHIGTDNQNAIWKYLQTLIVLMDKC
jgi:hypothetical protein